MDSAVLVGIGWVVGIDEARLAVKGVALGSLMGDSEGVGATVAQEVRRK